MNNEEYCVIPIIFCEDELLHTDETPQCDDLECPCHEQVPAAVAAAN